MKIIIDPGHGGKDTGGGTNNIWKEKDKVLEISLYQYKRFKELGIEVELTRDKDMFLDKEQRVSIVKESGANICISNHINAFNSKVEGVEIIHSIHSDGKLANMIMDEMVAVGAKKRRVFNKASEKNPKIDWYYMHRETGSVQTVIIEYGFADNEVDAQRVLNYWRLYAEAVIKAICKFINHSYIPFEEEKKYPHDLSEYAIEAYDWITMSGISDGSRPKDFTTREEVWAMLYRLSNSRKE